MAGLYGFLFIICFLMFLLGVINPKWVLMWEKEKTRKKVGIYYGTAFFIFFILLAISIPADEQENKTVDIEYSEEAVFSSNMTEDEFFSLLKKDDLYNEVKEILPAIIWDRTYGGGGYDSASSLIQTIDGGYAVAGHTNSKGAGGQDFWVIKLDKQGNEIWDRTYGGSNYDLVCSLIQTTDGGYAVAGHTNSKGAGGQDFWVIKLDKQGNEIWDRTYGGSNYDLVCSLIQTTDGGYAVAGSTESKGAGEANFWVIKLDKQGNEIWDRTYGGSGYDVARSLIQTTDGGYAVAGDTESKGAGEADFWVIKLDENGNLNNDILQKIPVPSAEEAGTYALRDIGPAGGYIFYDKGYYSSGWRYLEAAPVPTEWTYKEWSSDETWIGGTGTGIGTGQSNTTIIVTWLNSHSVAGKAAQLCNNLTEGGYYDWFLPSKDELNLIYVNLKVFAIGGFADDFYWSSSEDSAGYVWEQSFHNGYQFNHLKTATNHVRAVRAF